MLFAVQPLVGTALNVQPAELVEWTLMSNQMPGSRARLIQLVCRVSEAGELEDSCKATLHTSLNIVAHTSHKEISLDHS